MFTYFTSFMLSLTAWCAFFYSPLVQAARPFLTDDATIVDACQIESWWQGDAGEYALWAQPACQIGQIEWSLGTAFVRSDKGSTEPSPYALSAKTVLHELEANGYGVTLAVGHDFSAGTSFRGDSHLLLAYSKSWFDDQLLLHANLGRLFTEAAAAEWIAGLATQWQTFTSQWLFVELYREAAGRPLYQLGYLFEAIPERLQLDLSYGNRLHSKGSERFVSAGFVFYFNIY